jgi:N,N'-diacetyllegionaminate synthase
MTVFFIAEAGVNHNGDLDTAIKLIDIAAAAGADAVKFQTFKASSTVKPGTKTVDYQKTHTDEENQHALLQRLELSEDDHAKLADRCAEKNIEFMSTAFDEDCADFLNSIGIQRIKVPSGEVTNLPFIKYLAATNLPIILSTGMATLEEISDAVNAIKQVRAQNNFPEPFADIVSILHCTSAYPTPPEQLNLRAIYTLRDAFDCPVGYSDHSGGIEAGYLAVALGATVYEKHFTLDRSMPGPDHQASLEPDELTQMIDNIRRATAMLGTGEKVPQLCEMQARELVRRSLYAACDVAQGATITADDIAILRPPRGLAPKHYDALVGGAAKRAIAAGEQFEESDL